MEIIKQRYSHEIDSVRNRLNYLEQGYVKEITGVNMHGNLSTNVQKLREEMNALFSKVVNGSESVNDDPLRDLF